MEYIYTHKVHYYETDRMGVTHHSNYIRFMEETRVAFMEEIGYGYERMEAEGVGSPVMGITCDYKTPTTFADPVEIHFNVLEMSPLKIRFGYTMMIKGKVACTATSLHCFLDSKTGRPIKYLERFAELEAVLKNYMK